ncbi:MAG TPA: hypothetical protein VGK63_00910, partial [Candidatus Limnocylindrales bacterium]
MTAQSTRRHAIATRCNKLAAASAEAPERTVIIPDPGSLPVVFAAIDAGTIGLLGTALVLGFRHGF